MDVLVRLSLQGGHKWEFCCEKDDPIIIGLMSALPGADLGGNLPADGLIQLETRTGKRLFLTRFSLVSMSIVPVTDEILSSNFLTTSLKRQSEASKPASFVLVTDALPAEVHRILTEQTLACETAKQDEATNTTRELSLGALHESVAKALQLHIERYLATLGITESCERHLQLRLFAIGNGGSISWEMEPEETASLVYHFHQDPKAFKGGGVRLFDGTIKNDVYGRATFRDVEIKDNTALIFPGDVVSAGLPVYCASGAFTDSLFVLQGSLVASRG